MSSPPTTATQQNEEESRTRTAPYQVQAERPPSSSSSSSSRPTFCWTRELHELYLHRLGLDAAAVPVPSPSPSPPASPVSSGHLVAPHPHPHPCTNQQLEQLLAVITEAHLRSIPFENLSQHGANGGPQSLDVATIIDKVLRRHRGGFCFELNALLAEWLLFLGYYRVKRIPAIVYAGDEIGFRDAPSHLILLVSVLADVNNNNNGDHHHHHHHEEEIKTRTEWLVDVAFGEPAIHPLRYVMELTQTTPEGMESRLKIDDKGDIILEWNKPDQGGWIPRLKWKEADTVHGLSLADFAPYLASVLDENSVFAKKMLICCIDRTEKRTLSGTKYKITSPRFGAHSQASVRQLASDDEARRVLQTDFGIAMEETVDLSTAKSDSADPTLFSHM